MTTILKQKQVKKVSIPSYRPRFQLRLNETQQRAYDLLTKGLSSLSNEELKNLDEEEKRSIIYNHDKIWKIIHRLKQEKMNRLLSTVLNNTFGDDLTGNAVYLLIAPITDNTFKCHVKQCEVDRDVIIQELIKYKLLPNNFLA